MVRRHSPSTHPATSVIRIALVDDHQLLTQALALVLSREPDMAFVGSAATGADGVALVSRTRPDVLVIDVNRPDGDGLAIVPALHAACPHTKIVVLTSMADENTLLRAVEAGVSGFVSKDQLVANVLAAIRQAAAGDVAIPAELLAGLLARRRTAAGQIGLLLALLRTAAPTARELDAPANVAGRPSPEPAAQPFPHAVLTVRARLRNVIGRMQAPSRLEAVTVALRRGLNPPPRRH